MPKIQMRRDTAANWKTVNPVLLSGEWALETDTRKMKIGDGVTPYNTLEYFREDDNEWVKPDDWIDIRSGALANSVYFLVGHSADFSTYPDFAVEASISNSNSYNVYVDGIKISTVNSADTYSINWQTLNLVSGFDVTYPSALRTHIVRVSPSNAEDEITAIRLHGADNTEVGLLWAHFTTISPISLHMFASSFGSGYTVPVFEAVTSMSDDFKVSNLYHSFYRSDNLKTVPVIDASTVTSCTGMFANTSSLREVTIKNLLYGSTQGSCFVSSSVKKINAINSEFKFGTNFNWCRNLIELPTVLNNISDTDVRIMNADSLQNTVIDLSEDKNLEKLWIYSTTSTNMFGIKGIIVSDEAPFNASDGNAQINIGKTGLDRQALITLFNSLPTVYNGQTINVAGCLGTADLTLADVQIATDKGWNVDGLDIPATNSLPYTLPIEFEQ